MPHTYSHVKIARLWSVVAKPIRHEKGSCPLLIFLHGAGERGCASGASLDLVLKHGPWKNKDFENIMILAPQCPLKRTWPALTCQVLQLIKSMQEKYRLVDRDKCILCGLSMGAFGCWSILKEAPDMFMCVISICGGVPSLVQPELRLGDLIKQSKKNLTCIECRRLRKSCRQVRVWLFHSTRDSVVVGIES